MNDQRQAAKDLVRRCTRFGLALLPLLTPGCLFVGVTERTEFEEAKRIPVRFLSERAAHDFHDAHRQSDREQYTDVDHFVMPFLVGREQKLYRETAHYNAGVRLADVNRDSDITEDEARAYLEYTQSIVDDEDDG